MKNNIKKISIVIPVLNEEKNIGSLIDEIIITLNNKIEYEIIVVDDGSTDRTTLNIKEKIKKKASIKLIAHKKNYGQSCSLRTGITHSNYDYIVTLDGDGQNDPSNILDLINHYNNNTPFFLVIGNRRERNDTFARRVASRFAFFIRRILLNDNIPDTGCALKVFKKKDFLFIPFFNHIHRFLPFLFLTMGGEVVSIDVKHRQRKSGISKYSNFQRALVGIYDLFGVIWLRKRSHSSVIIKEFCDSTKNSKRGKYGN